MANENKKFNYGLYAVIAFVVVAAILATTTVITFKSKYLAFSPETLAVNFTDSVVQKGDGYNAYKYTLSSKSEKYGDFIRINYIYPLIYPGYEIGMDSKAFDDIKKNGLDTDEHKSDATANDDGSLAGQLADKMYPYYVELMKTYGWDNYDAVYTNYFARLIEERKAIFGDDYLSDEVMFTALEANVATYGDALTGTEDAVDENTGIQTSFKSTGLYETKYGEDYKLTTTVKEVKALDVDAYKANLNADILKTYEVSVDDISNASEVTVEVSLADGTAVSTLTINEVQIGNTWYVDNTTTSTADIYALHAELPATAPTAA